MQDGLDLIEAVARHPATGPRLARKLYDFFLNEETMRPIQALRQGRRADLLRQRLRDQADGPPPADVGAVPRRPQLLQALLMPAEFVVRSLKEVGWNGFSLANTLTPLLNMGQQLFEPPDVNGWELGRGWFSTGGMLSRMNFAAQLALTEVQPARSRAAGGEDAGSRCCRSARQADADDFAPTVITRARLRAPPASISPAQTTSWRPRHRASSISSSDPATTNWCSSCRGSRFGGSRFENPPVEFAAVVVGRADFEPANREPPEAKGPMAVTKT